MHTPPSRLANLGGAFLGSMPAGGGTSQTAVNRMAGARTQAAEVEVGHPAHPDGDRMTISDDLADQ